MKTCLLAELTPGKLVTDQIGSSSQYAETT